jgi:2-polyprenyl-3-methyl-5-hydroxy-6-metoxy-1,4-benzoquinol methylase
VCGGAGEIAYSGLHDRIYGVPGEWTLRCCRNRNCGHLWLDPMPIEEDLPRLYENYSTHSPAVMSSPEAVIRPAIDRSYWTTRYGNPNKTRVWEKILAGLVRLVPGQAVLLDQAVFELPVKPGGRLLEIGFGDGSAMRRMADLGWEVQGFDFDRKCVDLARSRGLEVRSGTFEAQDYPSDMFDAVVMSHVLEHVPDPRALLAECRRLLKPGGRLVSITPNASSWAHKIFGRDWSFLHPPQHLHIFTSESLQNLARDAGWSRTVIKSSFAHTCWVLWASYKLRRDGRLDLSSGASATCRILVRLFHPIVALRHRSSPEIGEELVLHAFKDE